MDKLKELGQQSWFKDADGKVVLGQRPNLPLLGWLIFEVIALLLKSGQLKNGFSALSMAFLFTWAFLEITQGVNYFRRLLGLVVITLVVGSYF